MLRCRRFNFSGGKGSVIQRPSCAHNHFTQKIEQAESQRGPIKNSFASAKHPYEQTKDYNMGAFLSYFFRVFAITVEK